MYNTIKPAWAMHAIYKVNGLHAFMASTQTIKLPLYLCTFTMMIWYNASRDEATMLVAKFERYSFELFT